MRTFWYSKLFHLLEYMKHILSLTLLSVDTVNLLITLDFDGLRFL